jgi:hypothetical protein
MEMVGKELQELGNCLYDLLSCVFVVVTAGANSAFEASSD